MGIRERLHWDEFKTVFIDDWQSFIPQTQDELVGTLFWSVVLTTIFFIVLLKVKRPFKSMLPLLVATPIFFIFFSSVVQPAYDYDRYIAVFVLTVLVQAGFVYKAIRSPLMYFEMKDARDR